MDLDNTLESGPIFVDFFNFTGSWGRNFVYSLILTKEYNFTVLIYLFVEHFNSWVKGNHEFHEK